MTSAALPPAPGIGGWTGGLGLSVLAHGAVLAVLAIALAPAPLPEPGRPPVQVQVRSEPVARGSANPVAPDAPPAPSAAMAGARPAPAGMPPMHRARAVPPAPATAAATPPAQTYAARPPATQALAAAAAPAAQPPAVPAAQSPRVPAPAPATLPARPPQTAARPVAAPAPVAPQAAPAAMLTAGRMPASAPLPARDTPADMLISGRVPASLPQAPSPVPVAVAPAASMPDAQPPAALAGVPLPPAALPGVTAPPLPPAPGARLAAAPAPDSATRPAPAPPAFGQTPPPAPASPSLELPSERQVAALVPDATGLIPAEALAAFLRPGDILPGDAGALAVRDGIAATLAQFPCARIQSAFNPDTGSLDLRGHIPDPAMRAAVTESLQAQLGPGVPVTGALLILPRPQCQMLAALDALGLPQSSEQFTNPRVIGADAHVRDYSFVEGDRLVLDLIAPDYPAHILVDYFDAQGQVLHLQPNDFVPDRLAAPAQVLTVGRAAPGLPALDITISPPFGQEIAVALAVSAPLFAPPRPLVEPAAAYLADLRARLTAARAADPAFKGEWVYFFVTTAAR